MGGRCVCVYIYIYIYVFMDYPSSFGFFCCQHMCFQDREGKYICTYIYIYIYIVTFCYFWFDSYLIQDIAKTICQPVSSKAVSAMQHRQVPPNLHLSKLNPHIDVEVAWMKTGQSSYFIIDSIHHMTFHLSHITAISFWPSFMEWHGWTSFVLQFHTAYHGSVHVIIFLICDLGFPKKQQAVY